MKISVNGTVPTHGRDEKRRTIRALVYQRNGRVSFDAKWGIAASGSDLEAKRKYGEGLVRFPDEETAWLRPLRAGICGTDLAILSGSHGSAPPVVLGHEFIGIVEEVGVHVRHVASGDLVAVDPNVKCGVCRECRVGAPNRCLDLTTAGIFFDGGMAELCRVPARQLYRLPQGLSLDRAALFEPASCVMHGIAQFPRLLGERALVFGGGPIGVLFALALHARGVKEIVVVEAEPYRSRFVRELGIAGVRAIEPREADVQLERDAWDTLVDATGLPEVTPALIRFARPGGQVNLFGQQHAGATVDAFPVVEANQKELTIVGSYATRFEFEETIDFLQHDLPFEKLITHTFSLEEFETAFRVMRERQSQKVLFLPNGETAPQ